MDEQNQEQNQAYAPVENQATKEPEKKQTGSIIGAIIVIIVIIIGGLYFWGSKNSNPDANVPPVEENTPAENVNDPISDSLNNTSKSDNLDAIESDLNATDVNAVDQVQQ